MSDSKKYEVNIQFFCVLNAFLLRISCPQLRPYLLLLQPEEWLPPLVSVKLRPDWPVQLHSIRLRIQQQLS
jgi:hypothetical protein